MGRNVSYFVNSVPRSGNFSNECWERQSFMDPECFWTFLLGMLRMQGHGGSLPRPFVRVGLVWAILRDEQAHVLLAIKRRLPWAQCSLVAVQTYYMWNINLGSSTSLPWDFGERRTMTNPLILIVLVLWLGKSFVFDQWVLCLLPACMK